MAQYTAPRWFQKELRLIDPGLTVKWCPQSCRWIIYHEDGSPCLINQHPQTKEFYPLDQRILRKLRVNLFFTHNPKAMEKYLEGDGFALLAYMERGIPGVEDYLSGWM